MLYKYYMVARAELHIKAPVSRFSSFEDVVRALGSGWKVKLYRGKTKEERVVDVEEEKQIVLPHFSMPKNEGIITDRTSKLVKLAEERAGKEGVTLKELVKDYLNSGDVDKVASIIRDVLGVNEYSAEVLAWLLKRRSDITPEYRLEEREDPHYMGSMFISKLEKVIEESKKAEEIANRLRDVKNPEVRKIIRDMRELWMHRVGETSRGFKYGPFILKLSEGFSTDFDGLDKLEILNWTLTKMLKDIREGRLKDHGLSEKEIKDLEELTKQTYNMLYNMVKIPIPLTDTVFYSGYRYKDVPPIVRAILLAIGINHPYPWFRGNPEEKELEGPGKAVEKREKDGTKILTVNYNRNDIRTVLHILDSSESLLDVDSELKKVKTYDPDRYERLIRALSFVLSHNLRTERKLVSKTHEYHEGVLEGVFEDEESVYDELEKIIKRLEKEGVELKKVKVHSNG